MAHYNVWTTTFNRWTDATHFIYGKQEPKTPHHLTKDEAEDWAKWMNRADQNKKEFEVREIPDTKNQSISSNSTTIVVNDYICPGCLNDKCSRNEKSCWKCGYRFVG